MTERFSVAVGALAGGVLGAAAAHFLLTERGRQTLRQLRPALHELSGALQDCSVALERLGDALREGRRVTRELQSDIRAQAG